MDPRIAIGQATVCGAVIGGGGWLVLAPPDALQLVCAPLEAGCRASSVEHIIRGRPWVGWGGWGGGSRPDKA